jgi:hypothetical protein
MAYYDAKSNRSILGHKIVAVGIRDLVVACDFKVIRHVPGT